MHMLNLMHNSVDNYYLKTYDHGYGVHARPECHAHFTLALSSCQFCVMRMCCRLIIPSPAVHMLSWFDAKEDIKSCVSLKVKIFKILGHFTS